MTLLGTGAAASAQKMDPAVDPNIDPVIRGFLKQLNADGMPLRVARAAAFGTGSLPHPAQQQRRVAASACLRG